jgi:lysozyme family protein
MASFEIAYEWMMDNEDAGRKYALVPDDPPGAHAISGINSAAFPNDFEMIAAKPQAERGQWVKLFYHVRFWSPTPSCPTWYAQLLSDEVAKRVFDAAVNMGEGTAVKLLQTAIEAAAGISIGVDGEWGPATLHGANNCNPDMLSAAFRRARVAHYREIVLKNPAKGKFLDNWLARAGK